MSYELWKKLPEGFLRKNFQQFCKIDHDVKRLIVELAERQNFKCALCTRDRHLIIEHDHEPDEGAGDRITIRNIRGLVCHRCNTSLSVYERQESGNYFGLEHVTSYLSSHEYENYIYAYDCRVAALREALLEKKIPNYWHRRLVLDKFDDWFYEGGQPPIWYRRYKEQQNRKIETPEQAIKVLIACMKFVADEFKKNPDFEPPEEFLKLMILVRPIIEQAKAIRENTAADRTQTDATASCLS
ncbi:MAG: hypothetical protein KIT48_04540 [Pseudolabrys sp.]|nr:hypothetical protein [Pseudolabrys sp.]